MSFFGKTCKICGMEKALDLSVDRYNSLPQGVRKRVVDFLARWGRWEEAYPFLEALAEEQSDAVYYRSRLAHADIELGRLDDAEEKIRELELDWPNSTPTLAVRGELHLAREEYPEALKAFLKILELRPDSAMALYRVANVYFRAGIPEKSLSYARSSHEFYEGTSRGGRRTQPPPGLVTLLADLHEQSGDAGLATELRMELEARQAAETEYLMSILASCEGDARPKERRVRKQKSAVEIKEPETILEETPPGPAPPLPGAANETLHTAFAYKEFRQGQEEVVARVLNGESLIVIMPTGGGKSLCYQLPALILPGVTLVISPLIALMKDQLDGLPDAVREKATLVNSMLESDELERRLADIARGKYKMVYAAPERLRQQQFLHALAQAGVSLFVVDEVHCISIWGHDFRPDYLFIPHALKHVGGCTFMGMTATATPGMRHEIRERMGQNLTLVSTGTFRPNLYLEVQRMKSDEEKMRALIQICASTDGSGIVYVTARVKAEELAILLRRHHVNACHYHAGMEREERDAAQDAFMSGRCRVVVATVAFGMGVDKTDVRFVVHYSLPRSLENYYQEAGRAGRDGKPSRCVLFYAPGDKARLTRWMKEGRLSLDIVKSVYLSVKEQVGGRRGLISDDDIQRDADVDETGARIALSLLERSELIRRRMDVPRSITLWPKRTALRNPEFAAFAEHVRLKPDQAISFDIFDLTERAGMHPDALERQLLNWCEEGHLQVRSSGRAPFVEIVPTRKSAAPAIRQMLAAYEMSCLKKLEDLIGYVSTNKCRHHRIADHFGENPPPSCKACDICAPADGAGKSVKTDVTPKVTAVAEKLPVSGSDSPSGNGLQKNERLILDGVRLLPIKLGKRGLARALTGSVACPLRAHEWKYLGALDHLPVSRINDMVDRLIEFGYLMREGSPDRPLLALTAEGSAVLDHKDVPVPL